MSNFDEDLLKNLSPSEDDDDDDFDVDLLDDIEDEVEADKEKKQQSNTPPNPQTTSVPPPSSPHQSPFGGSVGTSSPWSTGTNQSQPWKQTYTPPGQTQPGQTVFPGQSTWNGGSNTQPNTWGNWSNGSWNNGNNGGYRPLGSSWNNGGTTWTNSGNRQSLPRQKKIVMCDLLDNVIEPLSAQGRVGSQPQGIYDMRIKFEVLDRFRAINPEYLFILTNQNFTPGTAASKVYKAMVDYLVYSIAEYMRLPYDNVRCITKTGYDIQDPNVKPNTGLIQVALKTIPDVTKRFRKEDILVCGMASGTAGQGNRDIEMARRFGVDYIDIQELLTHYF